MLHNIRTIARCTLQLLILNIQIRVSEYNLRQLQKKYPEALSK